MELYQRAGFHRGPFELDKIQRMYDLSNVVISAWDGDVLAGVLKGMSDTQAYCYLGDLAVRKEYQKCGIGKKLIYMSKQMVGEHMRIILSSDMSVLGYYPKIGMEKREDVYQIRREMKWV